MGKKKGFENPRWRLSHNGITYGTTSEWINLDLSHSDRGFPQKHIVREIFFFKKTIFFSLDMEGRVKWDEQGVCCWKLAIAERAKKAQNQKISWISRIFKFHLFSLWGTLCVGEGNTFFCVYERRDSPRIFLGGCRNRGKGGRGDEGEVQANYKKRVKKPRKCAK